MNADINRRLENLIRFGTIKTVNPSKPIPLVTVDLDDIVTPEIRFFNARSGDDSTWDLPSLDEEVMVISACGEIGPTSVVFYGLYNNEYPAPSDDLNKKIRVFADGCVIAYDISAHQLSAILPSGGKAVVTADGGITVNGNTTINGNLQVNGSTAMTGNNTVGGSQLVQGSSHSTGAFSTEADVKAGSISLKEHKHPGDSGGTTGGSIP
ncbi:phage baseplate assembly protein V [Acinetobacter nosocomialis]|uniref:phage baseplate assembly protein V n=1 Tax=Acinetobacter calcoaceticus/baumannii complex TaxID=909768 RepID=UPI000D0BB5AB|nr:MULTISPECIES: phage baseplate assembly protein V [Acinetobacter calcoaceticus/baumannii complex]MBJ9701231.1 phage baseplate assembly protein V [Acinetobacter baumannii]MBP1486578.1 phage baseplate assembly protein V [Acinetobacter nosocomialis]MDN8240084.1 phage baseplate assembly protein V [Acinetobacter baumannii]MDQ8906539.1 phage baseplate assembly protein V [Acinetobacter nosocomialis]PSE97293.1 phage baseplate assembly protein V [Acinetobacter nosocomialis]